MQAIILAAGMGKRLKELTAGNTKCMVKVNGISLIERALRILDKKNLSRIVIVVGYEGRKLIDYIGTLGIKTPIVYIDNPIYDKTNNIYSLSLAKGYLCNEDTLLLESDLIFEESLINTLIEDPRSTLALVDRFESWMDGTCMVLGEDDCIVDFIAGKHLRFSEVGKYYKTVNIYKFSSHFSAHTYVPFLEAYSKAMGDNEYYESVIKLIAMLETKEIRAKRLEGQVWYEIDDVQDLDIAETLFPESDEQRYELFSKRYGGYWRYPKLLDYCYLVNPYYPSEKMKDEMKASFDVLLSQYPSGMRVNGLLASKYFGIRQDQVVIGNGAAELISVLMNMLCEEGRKVGFIRPTFEEYPNRYPKDLSVVMNCSYPDYRYGVDDIESFFSNNNSVNALVLINPDNPSGNYLDDTNIHKLLKWCRLNNILLILDESFADFVDIEHETKLNSGLLDKYSENLIVVKSLSKSHGIPGIRLGVVASGSKTVISILKSKVAIWNINSFGEYYMQIAEKYKKDYAASVIRIAEARKNMIIALSELPYVRVLSSQANYVMCELIHNVKAIDLAAFLLKNNLYIKDLSHKIGDGREWIRLAVRTEEENTYLIKVLSEYHMQIS